MKDTIKELVDIFSCFFHKILISEQLFQKSQSSRQKLFTISKEQSSLQEFSTISKGSKRSARVFCNAEIFLISKGSKKPAEAFTISKEPKQSAETFAILKELKQLAGISAMSKGSRQFTEVFCFSVRLSAFAQEQIAV